MATQPITLLFVMMFMWPIPLVWKTDTNVQYVTVVSPPEQIYAYMENPQPRIRAVDLLYICMKCYLDLLYSHWMYTLWTIKKIKKKVVCQSLQTDIQHQNTGSGHRAIEIPCELQRSRWPFRIVEPDQRYSCINCLVEVKFYWTKIGEI